MNYLKKSISKPRFSIKMWGYIFVLPGIIWYVFFHIYPWGRAIFLSFHAWRGAGRLPVFIGLKNYKILLTSAEFSHFFRNTFYFTAVSVFISVVAGLFIAVLLTKISKFRTIFRTVYFAPTLFGIVAVSIIWTWTFQPQFGILNHVLQILHLPPQGWLKDPRIALPCLALVRSWTRLGTNVVIFLAGLLSIPQQFYDAAQIDGASSVQEFIHVTIPLVMPVTAFLLVLTSIICLQEFGLVFMLTEGGPGGATQTVAFNMYQNAFIFQRMGKGCAIAVLLFVVILVITVFQLKFLGRGTKGEY